MLRGFFQPDGGRCVSGVLAVLTHFHTQSGQHLHDHAGTRAARAADHDGGLGVASRQVVCDWCGAHSVCHRRVYPQTPRGAPRHLPNPPKFLAAPPLGKHALSLNTLRHIANTPMSKIAHDQNTVCFARPATRCSFLRRHKDATSSWHGPLARADQLEHLHHTPLESDLTVPLCN